MPSALSAAGLLIGPLFGQAITRYPLNRLISGSAVAMGLAFLAMSQATSLWQLGLGYALGVSLGLNAMSGVGSQALIVNWFAAKRALALGIAASLNRPFEKSAFGIFRM